MFSPQKAITTQFVKEFDETKFICDLQAVPWDIIQLNEDTDDILEAWSDLFLEVVDKHVPIKQHRVKHKNQPEWITPDILDAIKCRDRHKSLADENECKFWRNKVTKLIRNAKRDKYQSCLSKTTRVNRAAFTKSLRRLVQVKVIIDSQILCS